MGCWLVGEKQWIKVNLISLAAGYAWPSFGPLSRLNGKFQRGKTQKCMGIKKKKMVWRVYLPFERQGLVHLTAHLWMIRCPLSCDLSSMGVTSTAQQKWHPKKKKKQPTASCYFPSQTTTQVTWSSADYSNIKLQTCYYHNKAWFIIKYIAQVCIAFPLRYFYFPAKQNQGQFTIKNVV